jgi:nucleoid-associated protein YgaU
MVPGMEGKTMKRIAVVAVVAVLALAGCKKPQGPQTTEVSAPDRPAEELTPTGTEVAEVPEAPVEKTPAETVSTDEAPKPKESDKGYVLYTVKPGDGLMKIARQFYGDARRYKDIAKFNGITDTDKIKVGQVLKIPK